MAYPDEWNDVLKERDQLKSENERLQKYKEKLISDATQNEFVLLAYHDSLKEMIARVRELEQERDYLDTKCAAFENDFVLLDVTEKLKKAEARIAELEEALAKIANYESMRFKLSPYEYGLLEQIVGIAEHALRDGE